MPTSPAEVRAQHEECPVIRTIDEIGSKWRLIVLWVLRDGELRFNELKRETGANSQTLSRVLDDLGGLGFVDRRVETESPIAVYYRLTRKGREFVPLFDGVEAWAERWLDAE